MVVIEYIGLDFFLFSFSFFLIGLGFFGGVYLIIFFLDFKLEVGEINKLDFVKSLILGFFKFFFVWFIDVIKLGLILRFVVK